MTVHHHDPDLSGRAVAFLVAPEGAEERELTDPWQAVREAGGTPTLVSTVGGTVQTFRHLDRAASYPVDEVVENLDSTDFDALVLPGGVANPDYLRTVPGAVEFAARFLESGRPVAAICHAPWLLIETGLIGGRRLTAWPSLRTDVRNAGATWEDGPVVVCDSGPGPLITSRAPDDLPAFDEALLHRFSVAATGRP
ncbi:MULTISPECIES: type 1 glutamine amidotransferase domain-containing protein [Gordonia]|uniref:Peptidase C56 family protein n=2 Tax=Gordonia TaxID=2053 RepID=L7LK12_9ACTN|nr:MULTISPECIES: type 1 glutamine amidotransferase domain-containing protein [Gordonia]AUH67645.1 type 1 glutamine amidotransferase [Gordonia sp. YC-JH1]KJR08340.1 peptidase C56 family protein [Gordonia sihwensis]KXT57265.1 peptidase C56 family protein [Gordonia sp. QH-12]MBY4568759.1 glutamine amidotransferase [Gordonia sihwensis]GAC61455.1 peptidase C56 family protein [Gordonia sihwensis NBRC 108236]